MLAYFINFGAFKKKTGTSTAVLGMTDLILTISPKKSIDHES